jgi:hypothetical protein
MELIESKSILAKLMATENLHIEQRKVQTASFDVKNRILTIPIMENGISSYLYDLFMGHEVGHALYTPEDGMKKAYDLKYSMSVMNVLEDSRIERKIKNKYPGIRQSFIRAYKELVDQDFFGTAGKDLNELNFIDRINLYCKGGASTGIKFDDVETELLNKIESTQTYDDVIEIYKKVSDYMKSQEKENPEPDLPDNEDEVELSDEEMDEMLEEILGEKTDEQPDEDSKKDKAQDEGLGGEEGNKNSSPGDSQEEGVSDNSGKNQGGGAGGRKSKQVEEPVSETDEAYRKNERRMFSSSPLEYGYGNVPDLNIDKIIVDHSIVWSRYEDDVTSKYKELGGPKSEWRDFLVKDKEEFLKFREDSKKVVSYLVKEFELRKNADQMKRASISKTGELNMSKIFSYQFSEDIFKKITVVPGGKSHGLVMFIDWSGSMADNIGNTVKQLLNLVMFCKKINIPYEVYAFSTEYEDIDKGWQYQNSLKRGDMCLSDFRLLNLLSNKMSAVQFTKAAGALLRYETHGRWTMPEWFKLGGTPLNESIVAAMKIVPRFKKDNRLQIVNTVFLTDGEGNKWTSIADGFGRYLWSAQGYGSKNQRLVIRDPITKYEVMLSTMTDNELTSAYIKLLKVRTGCNIIGFYILPGRQISYVASKYMPDLDAVSIEKMKKEFRSNKFQVITNGGFDEYYLLRSEGLDTDDDAEFEVEESASLKKIASQFKQFSSSRKSSRVVLNRFIDLIA